MLKGSSLCLGTFWLKIEQFWPFEEINMITKPCWLLPTTWLPSLGDYYLQHDYQALMTITCRNMITKPLWLLPTTWLPSLGDYNLHCLTFVKPSMAFIWHLKSEWNSCSIIVLLKFFSICNCSWSTNSALSSIKFHFNICRYMICTRIIDLLDTG